MPPPKSVIKSTGLTITNPLVLYRSLLATKVIDPDPAQHRLALELQKLYLRLKDYSPRAEYASRLKALNRVVGSSEKEDGVAVAVPGHPLRRNPLFSHLFARKQERDTKALTRVLTSHESAIALDSPKGLLLYGEVGTGKSLLADLLADSLPNKKKRRWHFNTFMLETLAKLEQLRIHRSQPHQADGVSDHSLLWLAKDMIEESPILFLDEFQLPDRAASKILSRLLTSFFQLGGVLIATSNRMPEELSKASGMDFSSSPRGSLIKNMLGFGQRSVLSSGNEYGSFVEVLKARCEIWDMEGGRDWRRREAESMDEETHTIAESLREEITGNFKENVGFENSVPVQGTGTFGTSMTSQEESDLMAKRTTMPKKYFLSTPDQEMSWRDAVRATLPSGIPEPISWLPTILIVYGRKILVDKHMGGISYWSFTDLCGCALGPADYITLASRFHTLIIDHVPTLSMLQKNEARRLITLLDALYEARCKLLIRADAGPDELFFPEISKDVTTSGLQQNENNGGDAVYPETLSEIYQDQISPFRPNISSYEDQPKTGYDPDEDSDFGPQERGTGRAVDFGMTSSFTGEDERFAYKRARSRMWEMCGERWHSRDDVGWWRPVPPEVRRWERSPSMSSTGSKSRINTKGDVQMGNSIELDKPAGLQGRELEGSENR